MVWGAISWNNMSSLEIIDGTMTAAKYRDLLDTVSVPFWMQAVGAGFILQDDNARPHRGRIVMDYHDTHDDYVHMQWPASSPDLNPIEHVWDMLGRRIQQLDISPRNMEELMLDLQVQWANITQLQIRKLYRSMRRRVRSVISAQGGGTHY